MLEITLFATGKNSDEFFCVCLVNVKMQQFILLISFIAFSFLILLECIQ